MVFDESCYLSGLNYHSWKTQLQGHTRVSMYSTIREGYCLNDLIEGDYSNDFDFLQNLFD